MFEMKKCWGLRRTRGCGGGSEVSSAQGGREQSTTILENKGGEMEFMKNRCGNMSEQISFRKLLTGDRAEMA